MNIFEQAPEFIEWDNRTFRRINQVTAESVYNRFSVQLPPWLVKDKTVLDLGSCLCAAGHLALTNGAKHYTGIEIQEGYFNKSQELMNRYWDSSVFEIQKKNIEDFLDECISNAVQYDIIVASGVLYTFLNLFNILEKFTKVAKECVVIDTSFTGDFQDLGIIAIRKKTRMICDLGKTAFAGIGSSCNLLALDIIMNDNMFYRTEDKIIPLRNKNSHDSYSDMLARPAGKAGPSRYITRYFRKNTRPNTLLDDVINRDLNTIVDVQMPFTVVKSAEENAWKFDPSVADRFQQEASQHIPDYQRVINLCLELAKNTLQSDSSIIDVGSALGHTVDYFIENGFTNIHGVENSQSMIERSLHRDQIMFSDTLPAGQYDMIMINWTLHFIVNKIEYLFNCINNLKQDGYLILTDKTTQSLEIKKMYYDFKLNNGVDLEYIKEKEQKLQGVMHSMPADWYINELNKLGFKSVEVINSSLGFVTYMCKK